MRLSSYLIRQLCRDLKRSTQATSVELALSKGGATQLCVAYCVRTKPVVSSLNFCHGAHGDSSMNRKCLAIAVTAATIAAVLPRVSHAQASNLRADSTLEVIRFTPSLALKQIFFGQPSSSTQNDWATRLNMNRSANVDFKSMVAEQIADARVQCPMPVSANGVTSSTMPNTSAAPMYRNGQPDRAYPTDQDSIHKWNIAAMRDAMPCNNSLDPRR